MLSQPCADLSQGVTRHTLKGLHANTTRAKSHAEGWRRARARGPQVLGHAGAIAASHSCQRRPRLWSIPPPVRARAAGKRLSLPARRPRRRATHCAIMFYYYFRVYLVLAPLARHGRTRTMRLGRGSLYCISRARGCALLLVHAARHACSTAEKPPRRPPCVAAAGACNARQVDPAHLFCGTRRLQREPGFRLLFPPRVLRASTEAARPRARDPRPLALHRAQM